MPATALGIVATSRETLGVSGETVCRVPSLSLPEALSSVPVRALVDAEATQLFIERASAVGPAFTPTEDNAGAIDRICRRLDGIPLAIELAAARVVVLSHAATSAKCPWKSVALFNQATAAFELGDYKEAAARAEDARQAAYACGEALDLGGPLVVLANLARSNGDYDRAQQLYDEAIKVLRNGGEVWALAILLTAAAGLSIVRDDLDQARAQASEAMSLSQDLEDPRGIACSLELFAGLMAARGRAESAAQLWGASEALLERVSGSLAPNVSWIRNRYIEVIRASLGHTLFEAAGNEGRAMPSVKAIELALQQASLLY